MPPTMQYTSRYKTFIKRSLRQALIASLQNHPDPTVKSARVALDFGAKDFSLPAIIIKFVEKRHLNAGVGHYEWLPSQDEEGKFVKYQHRIYEGSAEFDIYGKNTVDRDLLSDALVDLLGMDEVSSEGQAFLNIFYNQIASFPYGQWHFPTLNLDIIEPSGEDAVPPPWKPEDQLIYVTSYKVTVFGEYYSYTAPDPTSIGPIEEVDVYEWPVDGSGNAINPARPAVTDIDQAPAGEINKYTGWPSDAAYVPRGT